MKILITGSGGFIGKNLKTYLKDKYELLTPRSFELNLINGNEVNEYFQKNDIDFVIHCATVGGNREQIDKETTIEENVSMVENILARKKADTRVILFGSGAMYDKSRNLNKVSEREIGSYIPKDLYGKSKLITAEKIKNNKDVLMLNIFACYGYGEKESRFPSYAIDRVLEKKDIEINQNVVFDYLFVEDMQRIVEYFIKNKPSENIINITPSKSISLLEIAEIVNKFTDTPSKIIIKNKKMNYEYTGNNSLLLKEYKDCSFMPIEAGLKKLFDYKLGLKNSML